MRKLLFLSLFLSISLHGICQVGESTGLEFGFVQGGMTGFPGYSNGGLFSGAIFKEFMARKTGTNVPTVGVEMKLNWSYYSMDNGSGNSFYMNVYTLPVMLKANLGSSWTYTTQREGDEFKTYSMFRAVYLYVGPEAGYWQTNATHPGTVNQVFGGVVGGIQIWINRFKIDVYGHRSVTPGTYTPGNDYIQGGAVAFGVAF
jgi:hypothetical protein